MVVSGSGSLKLFCNYSRFIDTWKWCLLRNKLSFDNCKEKIIVFYLLNEKLLGLKNFDEIFKKLHSPKYYKLRAT